MKGSLSVRFAWSSDGGKVAEIARRVGAAYWSREAYAAEAERPDSIFLVAEQNELRGYIVARIFENEVRLLDFAAAQDSIGIGRALWASLTASARARGASRLTLEVSSRNSRARLFYERAGARVVGRRPKFYNDGSDAVLMDLPFS